MLDIERWLSHMETDLRAAFGSRLLFWGLQGSYRRGEATEDSDIDLVTVLDTVALADLDAYRTVVAAQPDAEKACGFFCGREELENWPRYDLFQLYYDTRPLIGSLDGLVPAFAPADAAEAAAVGASGIYHAACHYYLYGSGAADLPELYKAAFFVLRARAFCRTGVYAANRRELEPLLAATEKGIFDVSGRRKELAKWPPAALAEAREALLVFCAEVLGNPEGAPSVK